MNVTKTNLESNVGLSCMSSVLTCQAAEMSENSNF